MTNKTFRLNNRKEGAFSRGERLQLGVQNLKLGKHRRNKSDHGSSRSRRIQRKVTYEV